MGTAHLNNKMKNIETPHTSIPNLDKVITQYINNHIRFRTIQLFRKLGSSAYTSEGTEILIDFFGVYCLLPSKHIVENSFDRNLLYFKLGPEEYILCTGNTSLSIKI